ncbi:MAG: hypothetical protein ACYCQJ_02970 [Nitrososphaerales archaeon]
MGRVQSKRRSARSKTSTLILDAAPLIYLCKSGIAKHLDALATQYSLFTTREVYEEVYVRGLEKHVEEAHLLKELFQGDDSLVKVLPHESKAKQKHDWDLNQSGLHRGEITIIESALSLGATAIIDDKRARNVARTMGVNLGGTVSLVLEITRMKVISKSKAKEAIAEMIGKGWYCSTKDYVLMMKAIDDI